MESSNLDSCVKAMSDMGIVWPDRRDGKVIDSIPKFTFESSVPKEFKNCFLHNNKESKYEVDELVRYIEGLPCLLAPREPKPDFVPQNGIFWSDIVDED
jgi:hypothetical protein